MLVLSPKETSLRSTVLTERRVCSALVCEVSNLINPAAAKPAASSARLVDSKPSLVNVVVACRRSSRRRRPRAIGANKTAGRNEPGPSAGGIASRHGPNLKVKTRRWKHTSPSRRSAICDARPLSPHLSSVSVHHNMPGRRSLRCTSVCEQIG